jgi:acyl-coenzyme A synthetase/AMP-(fatty) acid ligase
MDTSPLLSHASPSAVIAYRQGAPVSASQFLADATTLADSLPPGRHILNVCLDRYRFTVGLAACLMTGRVSLLPSTHTPEVIRQLLQFAPDVVCLTDEPGCTIELPRFLYPPGLHGAGVAWAVPEIPVAQLAAIVFTSGSTGTPLPYKKTWGRLARCVRDGAPRLGLLDGRSHTLIGTVPAQHMYGFESTVLLAMVSGNAFSAERPFYPADICSAVASVPRPRALISTPIHLRTLLAAELELPPLDLIVSATAPLDLDLAHEVEAKFQAPLLEIYGSTETGQIATRRTAGSLPWRLWPGVRLQARDAEVFAHGGHVEQMTAMCDVIEIIDDEQFLLHGRTADLVNVAGKRSSFAYLNTQLNAIAGVVDGAFFLRAADNAGRTGVARLAAVVVAPTLTAALLIEQLRQRIDPVFLPRPLLLVEQLPRNSTGKLPQAALLSFAERRLNTGPKGLAELPIAADHRAFAGHFPGHPILPGAALLDEVLHEIARSRTLDPRQWQVAAVKFLDVVRPGDGLTLEHTAPNESTIRFTVRNTSTAVASGTLSAILPEDGDGV